MKFLGLLVYWLCWAALGSAQSSTNISSCALTCLTQTIPASGCEAADITCQCNSKTLAQSTARCMLANCTMADSLALSKFEAGICKLPFQNRSGVIVAVFAAITTLAVVFVAARFVSGTFWGNKLGLQDWIVAAALTLAIPAIGLTFKMASEGFGKHLYSLEDGDLLRFLRNFYIAENIYVVVLAVTKLSILAFYLHIFQNQPWLRRNVWLTIGLICLSTTIISILTIVQCHPIEYFWDKDIKRGSCLNLNALAYANSAMSMIQDIIIIILPIPIVLKLNMSQMKKIGIALMFALGGFGCIVSAIRLRVLLGFGNSIDPTWDYAYVVIWTAIELGVAMVLTCLPAVRSLVTRLHPMDFISSIRSSKTQISGSRSGKQGRNRISRKREYRETDESNQELTRITVNGEWREYPREPPIPPLKNIFRENERFQAGPND